MHKMPSCSFSWLSSLLMLVLMLFISVTAACGSASAIAKPADVKSIAIKNLEKYSMKSLNIIIKPLNDKEELVNIEGNLDIEIWDDSLLLGGEKSVLQRWDDVPLTSGNFQDGIGNVLSLEYKSFQPEVPQNAIIHLTFTAGDSVLDAEEIIVLFPMACCYE